MTIEKINRNASLICIILDNKNGMPFTELKKISELTETELLLALGWLAREYRVIFYELKKIQMVTLLY